MDEANVIPTEIEERKALQEMEGTGRHGRYSVITKVQLLQGLELRYAVGGEAGELVAHEADAFDAGQALEGGVADVFDAVALQVQRLQRVQPLEGVVVDVGELVVVEGEVLQGRQAEEVLNLQGSQSVVIEEEGLEHALPLEVPGTQGGQFVARQV